MDIEMIKAVKLEEIVDRHIYHVERMIQIGEKSNVEKQVHILDLKGISLTKHRKALDFVKASSKMDQVYYPERLYRLFIINAPTSFTTIWALIKGLLDPETKKKIVILGADYQSTLLQIIDPSQLPVEYGGTGPNPFDPNVKAVIDAADAEAAPAAAINTDDLMKE